MFAIAGSFDTYGLLSELLAWQMRTFLVGSSTAALFAVSAVEAASVATSAAIPKTVAERRGRGTLRRRPVDTAART